MVVGDSGSTEEEESTSLNTGMRLRVTSVRLDASAHSVASCWAAPEASWPLADISASVCETSDADVVLHQNKSKKLKKN